MTAKEYIKDLLDKGHSTALRNEIIDYVGNDKKRMKALMFYFFHENSRYNQRAAWPLGKIGEQRFELIKPYLKQLIDGLSHAKHDAVLRNTLRIFQDIAIPEDLQGDLYDKATAFFIDLKQPAAIRIFSMSVMANIASPFPELRKEVLELINEYMPYATAGYKSRAKRIIKKFS